MKVLGAFLNLFLRKHKRAVSRLLDLLRGIKGISISAGAVSLAWGRRQRPSLGEVFTALNEWAEGQGVRFVLAFDEAQELRYLAPLRVRFLLAYLYDHAPNVVLVLTGSQMGLLYDFVGAEDPSSPLYGRARFEVRLGRLDREKSIEFLERGFQQHGIKPKPELLDEAVEKLDGIVGWLTYFGWSVATKGTDSVEEVLKEASALALEELEHFLSSRPQARRRYLRILRSISREPLRWSDIKRSLEAKEGVEISDPVLMRLLNNLLAAGLIERREGLYALSDPVLASALTPH